METKSCSKIKLKRLTSRYYKKFERRKWFSVKFYKAEAAIGKGTQILSWILNGRN